MTSKEAFKRLKFIADNELNTGSKNLKDLQEFWNYKEPLKVITDLVERDTPMKLKTKRVKVSIDDYRIDDYCPTCDEELYTTSNYCPHCGQKLDWSDDK